MLYTHLSIAKEGIEMAGHPLLPIIKENKSEITVSGAKYTVVVSTHKVDGLEGDVLGIKFQNEYGSMDSSIAVKGVDSYQVINALASKTQSMILPVLNQVSMIGFYLLTNGLEVRGGDAVSAKNRLYNMGARKIHKNFKHELPIITKMRIEGAFGWVMSKSDITQSNLYVELEREFARQIEILPC